MGELINVGTNEKGARFSADRSCRFVLWREWDDTKPMVMFVGLNPSTANEVDDDPTIRRCVSFAIGWGYGGLIMCNLYPYVTPYPAQLLKHKEQGAVYNQAVIEEYLIKVRKVICAWGSFEEAKEPGNRFLEYIKPVPVHCLGVNKDGSPKHPLYLSGSTQLIKYGENEEG